MVENVAGQMAELEAADFYLLSGLEQGMRFSEWVDRDTLPEYARLTAEEVDHRLGTADEEPTDRARAPAKSLWAACATTELSAFITTVLKKRGPRSGAVSLDRSSGTDRFPDSRSGKRLTNRDCADAVLTTPVDRR